MTTTEEIQLDTPIKTPYGDPEDWDGVMPASFVEAVAEHLSRLGWTVWDHTDVAITVLIPIEATGMQPAAKRGDHLSVWWSQTGGFMWAVHEPEHGGWHNNPNTLSMPSHEHPVYVVASIDHLLRNGAI